MTGKFLFFFAGLLPKNPFTRGVSILAGGTAFSQFLLAAAAPLLTRLYSPADFGLLAVYAGLLAILGVISSLRYELAIPLPEKDLEAFHLVSLCILIVSGMTVLVILVAIFFGEHVAVALGVPVLYKYFWLLPISLFLSGTYAVFNFWAIRTKQFSGIAGTKVWQSATTLLVQLILFKLGGMAMLIGTTVGQGVGIAILAKHLSADSEFEKLNWLKIKQTAKRYRKFPFYSSWAGLFNTAGMQLPPLMFASLFSAGAAGLYFLAHRVLTLPMSLIGNSVGNVFFANAVEAHREGQLGILVEQVHDKLAQIAMPPVLVVMLCGPELSALFFGENWRQAGDFAQWLSLPLYTAFITSPFSMVFTVIERQRTGLHLQIILLILRISGILLGALLGDLLTSVAFFSVGSATGYLVYIMFIIHHSKANLKNIVKSFIFSFFTAVSCLIPLLLYIIDKDLYLPASFLAFFLIVVRYGFMIKDV